MDFLTPAELRGKKKLWWVAVFAYVTIFLSGASAEFAGFDLGKIRPASETLGRYEMFLACAALLLMFFIPFAIFMYYSCRKMDVSWKMTILAFFSGWFISGSISHGLDGAGVHLLQNMISESFAKAWAPPIFGSIVEETLKLLVAVCLLALLGQKLRKQYLIAGMAVGMGFQIDEALYDIENVVKGSHHAYVTAMSYTINDRIISCLGSHWCYTGVAAVGIFLIFRQKQKKVGILLLLAAYLDHSFRDMPFTSNTLCLALSDAFMLVIIFALYMKTWRENKVAPDEAVAEPNRSEPVAVNEKGGFSDGSL